MKLHFGVLKWLLSAVITALLLTGCLGGGSSTPVATSITGTAATGAALAGTVDLVDANGVTRTVNIGALGAFTIDTTGLAAPFMLKATGTGADAGIVLFSLADGTTGIFNITPLTNLALETLRQGIGAGAPANLGAFFAAWNAQIDPADLANLQTELRDAMARVNANLQAQFQLNGLDEMTFDFLRAAFTPNGAGIDGVLDGIRVVFGEGGIVINNPAGALLRDFNFQISIAGINIGGGGAGGGGNCAAGATNMTFLDEPLTNGSYANGDQVCFTASNASLAFSGKTLANPTQNQQVQAPFSAYRFNDAATGYNYEVVFNNGTLHEINVLNGVVYTGQFSVAAGNGGGAGGGAGTMTLAVSVSGIAGVTVTVPNEYPEGFTEADFCGVFSDPAEIAALQDQIGAVGSLTLNTCSYSGSVGTVTMTLSVTTPVVMSVPYTLTYTFN
jgi:hypothetical protein